MTRFLVPILAGAMTVAAGIGAPHASAQSYERAPYDGQGGYAPRAADGPTAWGDPWLNEHDFDYNRRHWLPNRNSARQQPDGRYSGRGSDWDRHGRDDAWSYRRDTPGLGQPYAPRERGWDSNDDE